MASPQMAQINLSHIRNTIDPRHSLQARVGLTFGSLIVLLALLLSVLIERPAEAQIEEDIGNNLASLAFQIAQQMDQEVVERTQDLELLASLRTLRDPSVPLSEKRAVLKQVQQTRRDYAWLGLVDSQGKVTVSSGLPSVGADASEQPWFIQGQHALHVGVTQNTTGETALSERLLTLALPLSGSGGSSSPVLGAYLNWRWVQTIGSGWRASSPTPADVDLFILGEDGRMLYGSTAATEDASLLAATLEARPGAYGYSSRWQEDGQVYLTGYARSRSPDDFPASSWLILVRQRRAAAFAPVRQLQRQILLLGAGLGLLFLTLGWFLAGRIVRPLSLMATAADRIRAGDMTAEIPEPAGSGEIATLAHSLRTMVDTLDEQKADLARNQEVLEERVHERTRTLTALYQVLELANVAEGLPAALEQALAPVLSATGGEAAFIHLVDDDGFRLAARQGIAAEAVVTWRQQFVDGDPLQEVLGQQRPLTRSRAVSDRFPAERELAAYIGAPIMSGGQIYGVLSVLGADPEVFVGDALALVESVADEFGVIVENARLQQRAEQLAVLEERNRLARELHDSVTQSLYSLTLFAEAGRRMLAEGEQEVAMEFFGDVGETSQQALKEMRLLLHKLRPAALQKEGLARALRQRLNAVEERSGIANELAVEGNMELSPELEEVLYHIATEALNNALRHARASRVRVSVGNVEGAVELLVRDNGQGFEPALVADSGGMGMVNMRERARHAGGQLAVESAPGQGTTVRVRLPGGAPVGPPLENEKLG